MSKALICLAAAMIPLQPVAVLSCGCDAHGPLGVAAEACKTHTQAESGCCGGGESCCCQERSAAGSCCMKMRRAPDERCGEGGGTCHCAANDSSPPDRQAPEPNRHQVSSSDLAQPLAIAWSAFEDPDRADAIRSIEQPNCVSGTARCVILCRFLL